MAPAALSPYDRPPAPTAAALTQSIARLALARPDTPGSSSSSSAASSSTSPMKRRASAEHAVPSPRPPPAPSSPASSAPAPASAAVPRPTYTIRRPPLAPAAWHSSQSSIDPRASSVSTAPSFSGHAYSRRTSTSTAATSVLSVPSLHSSFGKPDTAVGPSPRPTKPTLEHTQSLSNVPLAGPGPRPIPARYASDGPGSRPETRASPSCDMIKEENEHLCTDPSPHPKPPAEVSSDWSAKSLPITALWAEQLNSFNRTCREQNAATRPKVQDPLSPSSVPPEIPEASYHRTIESLGLERILAMTSKHPSDPAEQTLHHGLGVHACQYELSLVQRLQPLLTGAEYVRQRALQQAYAQHAGLPLDLEDRRYFLIWPELPAVQLAQDSDSAPADSTLSLSLSSKTRTPSTSLCTDDRQSASLDACSPSSSASSLPAQVAPPKVDWQHSLLPSVALLEPSWTEWDWSVA